MIRKERRSRQNNRKPPFFFDPLWDTFFFSGSDSFFSESFLPSFPQPSPFCSMSFIRGKHTSWNNYIGSRVEINHSDHRVLDPTFFFLFLSILIHLRLGNICTHLFFFFSTLKTNATILKGRNKCNYKKKKKKRKQRVMIPQTT